MLALDLVEGATYDRLMMLWVNPSAVVAMHQRVMGEKAQPHVLQRRLLDVLRQPTKLPLAVLRCRFP